jgi:hypothetical protein
MDFYRYFFRSITISEVKLSKTREGSHLEQFTENFKVRITELPIAIPTMQEYNKCKNSLRMYCRNVYSIVIFDWTDTQPICGEKLEVKTLATQNCICVCLFPRP